MNILIIGGNSFISKSICPMLESDGNNVVAPFHQELDATNFFQLKRYISKYNPDYLINCAIKGGKRFIREDTLQDFKDNLVIQENLIALKDYYNKMIIFGSGSEYSQETDINQVKEKEYYAVPTNLYALSKYINSKRAQNENFITNLRLFNVFGPLEFHNRFITTALHCYINKKPIEIWHDIYLDFFYIDDLFSIIEYIIKNNDIKELNCCYKEKYKMSEVVEIINSLNNYKVPVIINSKEGNNYCGNGDKLDSIKKIKLKGLKQGIVETYNKIRKEK